jgi:hypothetical protein
VVHVDHRERAALIERHVPERVAPEVEVSEREREGHRRTPETEPLNRAHAYQG